MLRFATSPTGDMHIGDLYIALFNYKIAQEKKENFIVRIDGEDHDVLDILALFNINYSQVIYQSQNIRFHSAMALQLLHEKKAFSCFCSDEWLDKKRQEAEDAGEPYHYDDACRNLPAELVIDNTAPFSIRIASPKESSSTVNFDSFVIMHRDKTPTATFASAVEDMLSDISTVVCDESWRQENQKQAYIRSALGYNKEIEYIYIPTLLDAENVTVQSLLKEGYLSEAISNYLISFDSTVKSPIRFDRDRLKEVNKEYLKKMDATELSRYVGFADAEIGELARLYVDGITTTKDLKSKITPIFEKRVIPKHLSKEVETVIECIKDAPYFEKYNDFKNYIIDKTKLQNDTLSKVMPILLTNSEDQVDIAAVYGCLKNYIGEIIK